MKSIAIITAALAFSTAAHASAVTVSDNLPTDVGIFDGMVGQAGSYTDQMLTSIGSFWGDGIVEPYSFSVPGIAVRPADNYHAYLAVNGNETLILNKAVTSFSFLWGSVDSYNTAETIQGIDSVVVRGASVSGLLQQGGSAWVTIQSDTPFTTLEFHSLYPAMELQFEQPSPVVTPEISTWLMGMIGCACLGFSILRQRLATVSQWRRG